jgi:TolB protein
VPTAPPVAAANTPASLSGRIAFTIFRGPDKYGDFDIGLLDATGTAPRQVTQFGSFPVFSPDGQRILYYSWVEVGLYTMNSSGREQIGLPGTMDDSVPAWSPDGKRIAVVHGDAIWVMNADGSGRTKIIDEGDLPSWSPDSKQLVYQGCVAGDCGLAIADADGKNQRIITKGAGDTSPAWHPTGESILFTSRRSGQMEVWLTNVQGATARALTDSLRTPAGERASSGAATWSPDGKTIIFRSNRDGSWGIYIMNADGSGQRKIAVANASDEWWRERVSATK